MAIKDLDPSVAGSTSDHASYYSGWSLDDYPGERNRYNAEMMREHDFTPLDEARVEELDRIFGRGSSDYKKTIFSDRPVGTLVSLMKNGMPMCFIAERTYHEAPWGPIADKFAEVGREVFKQYGIGGSRPTMLDLNTGSGSIPYSFSRSGFAVVATVERNQIIYDWSKYNWGVLGFNTNMQWRNDDAWTVVDSLISAGEGYDLITADPPWRGWHNIRTDKFTFDNMDPSGDKIVRHLSKLGTVVALKAPVNLDNNDAITLANELEMSITIAECHLNTPNRVVREKMLYFIKGINSNGIISQQLVFNLSLTG